MGEIHFLSLFSIRIPGGDEEIMDQTVLASRAARWISGLSNARVACILLPLRQ